MSTPNDDGASNSSEDVSAEEAERLAEELEDGSLDPDELAAEPAPESLFRLPRRKLVFSPGYYAPGEYEYADLRAHLVDAWTAVADQLPLRQLLYLFHLGGGPGASSATGIYSNALPTAG